MTDAFEIVGIRPAEPGSPVKNQKWYAGRPVFSVLLLGIITAGCIAYPFVMTKNPAYMDLGNCNVPPCREFLFGTDAMGRDIFSMIWYGGRVSLFIGAASAFLSTFIAVVLGTVSATAPKWLDTLLMRLTDILLGIPSLLLILLLQAALGKANVFSLALVTGITSWTEMAKMVRTEVLKLRSSEYVIAAKCMGGGFFYILRKHLAPRLIPSILFMAVMNVRSAMVAESTLSFLGIGLPLEVISWGSMLSLAEKALLTNSWWVILVPGIFLVATLLCITNIGDDIRKQSSKSQRNL